MTITLEDLRSGRVPLRFGDPEQIAVLEVERARQDALIEKANGDERVADHNIKKRFTILVEGTFSASVSIEAFEEEDAKFGASEDWRTLGDVDYDVELTQVLHVEPL